MDIKVLLLESISLKKPICGSRRIYYGKAWFVINYVLNGKILNIKSIKHKRKRKTWAQRIKYYCMTYRMHESKKIHTANSTSNRKDIQNNTEEVQSETLVKNNSLQTICVQNCTKEVQTEAIELFPKSEESSKKQSITVTSTAQQTIASAIFSRYPALRKSSVYCQTNANSKCKGIHCKGLYEVKTTNIDVDTSDTVEQAENKLLNEESSEDATKLLAVPVKDFDVLIYMLNEIGDTVMSQNELLNTNSVMMNKIMQINTLKISKSLSDTYRSISTQTDQPPPVKIEKIDNCSQTITNYIKPRKLLLFKGRNAQPNQE